jgi:hypothetical protein
MLRPEFAIIGYRDCDTGRVVLTSLRQIRHATIDIPENETVQQYGVGARLMWTNSVTAEIDARHEGLGQVVADSYPAAWQKMFDLWVPPQMTEETKSQVLTHFTFNPPPDPAPADPFLFNTAPQQRGFGVAAGRWADYPGGRIREWVDPTP